SASDADPPQPRERLPVGRQPLADDVRKPTIPQRPRVFAGCLPTPPPRKFATPEVDDAIPTSSASDAAPPQPREHLPVGRQPLADDVRKTTILQRQWLFAGCLTTRPPRKSRPPKAPIPSRHRRHRMPTH